MTPSGATTETPLSGARTAFRNSSDIKNQDTLPDGLRVGTSIARNGVGVAWHPRSENNAVRFHPMARHFVSASGLASSRHDPGSSRTQADSALEQIGLVGFIDTGELLGALGA